MRRITFTCEVITSMFLAGADGETPELRVPSIKGVLRYWWRAMHGDLCLNELIEYEGKIFGDTKRRSQIGIQVPSRSIKFGEEKMLPHKEKQWDRLPKKCIPVGSEFVVHLSMPTRIFINQEEQFSINQLKQLFILVSLLGGLGKRSRRGFGSFKITKINGKPFKMPFSESEIVRRIKIVNPSFSFSITAGRPIITQIQIGTKHTNPREIGKATHDEKGQSGFNNYQEAIGAGNPRFASPIFISILPNGYPIITTLETVSPFVRIANPTIQDNLKRRIL